MEGKYFSLIEFLVQQLTKSCNDDGFSIPRARLHLLKSPIDVLTLMKLGQDGFRRHLGQSMSHGDQDVS
ncbi:hypothetical protein JHK87_050574 [Glycine soja]|nr:hypothetical protein JHK87_050574 [Glycine soja]